MFSHALCTAILGGLFLIHTLGLSALAETYTYRGEAEVQVAQREDYPLGLYLSKQIAYQRALTQAESMLQQQVFFNKASLNEADFYALATLLATNILDYESKNADNTRALYKVKIDYDSFKFPEALEAYKSDVWDQWITLNYERKHHENLEQRVLSYLDKRNQTNNKSALELLAYKEGQSLLNEIKADTLYEESKRYLKAEKTDDALRLINQSIEKSPDSVLYQLTKAGIFAYIGMEEKQTQKYDDAIKIMDNLISKHTGDPYLYLQRALLYMVQNLAPKQGLKDMQTYMRLKTTPVEAIDLVLLSFLAAYSGDKALSDTSMAKACQMGFKNACP